VTVPARVVFGLLVAATLAAFFVTQRLKHAPTVIQRVMLTPTFAPTGPLGRGRTERISFRIKAPDDVTVTLLDAAGKEVATLRRGVPLASYTKLRLSWNGVTAAGAAATPGTYRIRVRLRRQNRSVLLTRSFQLLGR